tara:strand:- start:264 stop:470 length:207 start_codon:yes stop_codon:yes gene_type:complete
MKTLNMRTLEVDNIDTADYPKFCDAYVSCAEWDDGELLSDEELDELDHQMKHTGEIYYLINDQLYANF